MTCSTNKQTRHKAQQLRKKGGCQRQPQTCWAGRGGAGQGHMCPPTRITMGQQDNSAGLGDIETTLSCFSGMKKTSQQPQKRRQFFLFFLSISSSCSFSFLVSLFFFCVCVDRAGCSPRNNNCKLKRTTGIQITLSRRNQLRQKDSTQLDSTRLACRCGPRAALPRGQFHSLYRSEASPS